MLRLTHLYYVEKIDGKVVYTIENKSGGETFEEKAVQLDQISLLVGVNASGKSKFLATISKLAAFIVGKVDHLLPILTDLEFSIYFENISNDPTNKDVYFYQLSVSEGFVYCEMLTINEQILIDGKNSKIFYEELKKPISFTYQGLKTQASIINESQHKFLKPLQVWASNIFIFMHGQTSGKETYFTQDTFNFDSFAAKFQDIKSLAPYFIWGTKNYPDLIDELVIDLEQCTYHINSITLENLFPPTNFISSSLHVLKVQEQELNDKTDQINMSQGMFRVFSLLLQINLAIKIGKTSLILIDDIGEGLDFSRSTALIKLIIDKLSKTNIQVIMTTNDQFVMNAVPLKYWQIVKRKGSVVNLYNYKNSKDLFDKFEFLGLNNFDFFKFDFISKA